MTTPQKRQTSAARDSTPIRTHSPYSEAEGPIVDRGYVEARVRAIEGDYKQLLVPHSLEAREIHHLPEWRLKGPQLRAPQRPNMASRSYGRTDDPFSDVSTHGIAKRIHDFDYGSPRQRKSFQQLPSIGSGSNASPIRDRKSQSLANLRARYGDSSMQNKEGQTTRSIGQRSPLEPGILSPQPLSPSKLFMAAEDDYQDNPDIWNEVHPKALTSIPEASQSDPMGIPNKSIAERMSDLISDCPVLEPPGPSTDWGSENNILGHPFRLRNPLEEETALEAHRWSSAAHETDESANSLQLRRVRPSHKVSDNTVGSSSLSLYSDYQRGSPQIGSSSHQSENTDTKPLSKAQRSLTTHLPRRTRTSSVAAWRTKLRSMSFDQLADKRQQATIDIQAPRQDTNIKAEASPSKPVQIEEGQGETQSKAHLPKSRQLSSINDCAPVSGSGALRRAWRKWSGWRLVLAEKPSQSPGPPGAFPATREATFDAPDLKPDETEDPGIREESPRLTPAKGNDHIVRTATPLPYEARMDLRSPPPQSPKRPISLLRDYSQSSISPTAARPTTALSPAEILDWPPSMFQPSRSNTVTGHPSLPPIKQSSSVRTSSSLQRTQSVAPFVDSSSTSQTPEQQPVCHNHGQATSADATSIHHKSSTNSTSTSTIRHSLYPAHKNSHQSMRSPWRDQHDEEYWQAEIPLRPTSPSPSRYEGDRGRHMERGGDRGRGRNKSREQRIKRVKVVVSLDGAGDLMVDARVKQDCDGQGEGRVRSFVKSWEASAID